MKKLFLFLTLAVAAIAQNIPAAVQRKTDGTNDLLTNVAAASGNKITFRSGASLEWITGATFTGDAASFRQQIGAGSSDFNGTFAALTGKPTTLAGYGITDPVVVTSTNYANPSWITSLAWSKITSTPTTLSGYGITDPVVLTSGSYANPSWITSLAGSKLTGAFTADGQTLSTARILGRATAGTGAAEELTASGVLDLLGNTRGSVIYRGASGWTVLTPGTNGYVLTSSGPGGDPSWAVGGGPGGTVWGSITGTLSNQTDLQTALDAKQPLAAKLTALGAMTWGTNTIFYSPTSSTVAPISSANLGVLVTDGSGVPSISTDLPTAVTIGSGYIYRIGGTDVSVTDGGTGISGGTSGGIPYFSGATSIASSAVLAANQIVLGGGAATAPSTLGSLGTTTTLLHGNAAGAPTFGAVSLTADVSGILPGLNGGTGNGFTAFSGPASSLKTFSLPNSSAVILTDAAAVTVAQGGTGISSGTSGGVPYFSASGTIASSAALTANRLVLGGGAGAAPTILGSLGTTATVLHGNAAGAPTFGAVSLTADVSGTLPLANGGTGQTTKAPAFDALSPMSASGDIIYGGASGTGTRLAKGSDGQVLTLVSGLPAWGTGGGGGTVSIVGAGSLTSTAIMTGGGTTLAQTPNASSTLDSSGNMALAGGLTLGSGSSVAGAAVFGQGTANSVGTTNATLQAPASVTSYTRTLEGSVGVTGVYIGTVSGTNTTDSKVAPGTSGNVLTSNGTTWVSSASAGGTGANPTATIGLTAVNGSASTYLRSDGAPALSQSITPTWTGAHIFNSSGPQITLGTNTTTLGSMKLFGNTSGDATIRPAAVAGTSTVVTLPNASSTLPIFGQQITFTGPTAARSIALPDSAFTVAGLGVTQSFTGIQTLAPTARSSGATAYFTITTPADTGQTTTVESIGINKTAATRTWATGTLATQREIVLGANTIAFAGASALTTAINLDIADPIQGTNATITNIYGLRANNVNFTGTFKANTGTNQIGPLVDSVDGTTPLNNIVETVAAGTAYTLTTSYAALDFGTTDPVIVLPNAGTYTINAWVQTTLVAATITTQTVSFKMRRTNNTAADLGDVSSNPLPVATAGSPIGPSVVMISTKYTTSNTNDSITIQGLISAATGAGSVTVSAAHIVAVREY